jgi:DNA modification methylase
MKDNSIAGGSAWPSMSQNGGPTERGEQGETGVSIFDPVLCELAYRWFCPPQAKILDPFAGGSVRGIVAARLGHKYVGVELRKEQVEANQVQGQELCKDNEPFWIHGDSTDIPTLLPDQKFDFVFSCPPYADLEVYSDDPKDLSTMPYSQFIWSYEQIIKAAIEKLNDDSFACFVVGEVRDKKTGNYYGFVPDTIKAFERAGAAFYNEIILVTAIGSLPIRAGKIFNSSRKIGKTHQNILVFVKGSGKRATEKCGLIDMSNLESAIGAGE